MTLLDAKQYDPTRDRRKRNRILAIVLLVLLLAGLGWWFRNWPEERAVDHFFDALQQKDYESAYGLWWNDPQWKQHQQKYTQYPYNEFYRDWGPGGEWGLVNSHRVHGSANPKGGSGVIVEVIVNERAEHARVWVQKSDKTLSFSPY